MTSAFDFESYLDLLASGMGTGAAPRGSQAAKLCESSGKSEFSSRAHKGHELVEYKPQFSWSAGVSSMSFEIGQTVVYPHHGAAKIEEISTRMIRGEEKIYLTLRVSQGDLTIQVPAENVDLVGVRDVVDEDGLETVLSVLRAPYIEEPTNWSRRFKANQEKIATGDIVKVAEVVRDLTRRDDQKKLSTGEKRMLTKARQILSSELALARGIDKSAAAARLDEVLAEGYDASLAIADDLPEDDSEE